MNMRHFFKIIGSIWMILTVNLAYAGIPVLPFTQNNPPITSEV